MNKTLEKEFKYYLDHQDELVEKYNGKFVVIRGCNVLGAYDTELEAIKKTSEEHELGTFLVQKCEPGSESYTQTYHSRVAFE
jgi:3-methyladenine DNA glycosylase AlkD